MSQDLDLKSYLDAWPYDPENTARLVQTGDGREILQVRLPLGLEQYELEGRPDGKRPQGKESFLQYHLERQAQCQGSEKGFQLNNAECAELFSEGMLYYYRYLHLFQLKQWRRTVRDTDRNLQLFDLVHACATRKRDQNYLEQWRPYVLRMNTIARAMIELDGGRLQHAASMILAGIESIESLPDLDSETFRFERERSTAALRELAGQIEGMQPVSEVDKLEAQLKRAVAAEEFEKAARLRDRIRQIRTQV